MSDDIREPTEAELEAQLMGGAPAEKPKSARAAKKMAAADPDDDEQDEGGEEARLHPILTNEQFLKAQSRAKERVLAERVAAAAKAVEDAETIRLRMEEGLTTGITDADEMVEILIDLPPYGDKILINGPMGKAYWHGTRAAVPRHVADTLNEIMYNMWRHENQTEGRSIQQAYHQHRDTSVSPVRGIKNAPVPPGRVLHPGQMHVQ